jgi:hypothetical protein
MSAILMRQFKMSKKIFSAEIEVLMEKLLFIARKSFALTRQAVRRLSF